MRLGTFAHFLASQDALGKMQFSGFCCSFPQVVYTVFSVTRANHAEKLRSKHQRLGRHKSFKPRILKSQLRDSRAKTGTFFAMEPKAFVCTSTWFEVINRAQCSTHFLVSKCPRVVLGVSLWLSHDFRQLDGEQHIVDCS